MATRSVEQTNSRLLQYFDIAADVSRSSTTDALQRACTRATRDLDFDYYLFGGYYPIVESLVISSSFPDEWRLRYDQNNYVSIDPVVRHCWSESSPVMWDRLDYADGKQGERERTLMKEAREFGLRSGISIPIHGAGAEGCMLSLASEKDSISLTAQDQTGLQLVAQSMHDVAKRIISRSSASQARITDKLSPREMECLSWTARGKTSWAIARILEVSENTVTFHLRNAIKKLEVTNRSHAVAKAISLSKITPF